MRLIAFLRRLRHDCAGVALIEFAYSMPIFLGIGVGGLEVTNMAITRMEVSQIALGVADNAARLGQTDNSGITPTIREQDVDAILQGAMSEGERIGLEANGRIILSSLEYHEGDDKQFIHWQRCVGDLEEISAYGDDGENNGLGDDELDGMGPASNPIVADASNPVMFVEVFYRYESLFGLEMTESVRFDREAAFLVRDDRNTGPGLVDGPSESPCD